MIEENTTAGKWERLAIELPPSGIGFPPTKHYIIRRNVMDLIAFVVGHTPFTPNMAYAPVRQRNSDGGLIFSEMHTANWWWETQDQLPPNFTIIPIILATDKTHLSQTHGDQQAWPVYITIGNLDRKTRRAPRRPGLLLLGLIPIVHKAAKAEVYHYSMGWMLQREYSFISTVRVGTNIGLSSAGIILEDGCPPAVCRWRGSAMSSHFGRYDKRL